MAVDAAVVGAGLAGLSCAVRLADSCGYRYYAMRARQLATHTATDEAALARHARVARALARSLAGNLAPEDSRAFMARQRIALGR